MAREKPEKNVFRLGIVSFLTDISSEMIYPILPLFMTSVLGLDKAFIGLIEGVAESTASITKLFSGWFSDRFSRRKPAIIAGYSLSSFSKPLLALVSTGPQVLMARFLDRLGKGVRTSPRDALLAESTPREKRGFAFGLHRSMDTAGAVIGPAVAFLLLSRGVGYRSLFLLAFLPAAAALLVFFFIRESRIGAAEVRKKGQRIGFSRSFGRPFYLYLAACTIFTLGNSSDAFIILRARDMGLTAAMIPLLWIVQNIVSALISTPAGYLSDRWGRKWAVTLGLFIYAAVYTGFAISGEAWQAWSLMALYGVYYGFTEGGFRAFVADLAPGEELGLAYGLFHFLTGISLLPASLFLGLVWERFGHQAAFFIGGGLALIAAVLMLLIKNPGSVEMERSPS